MASSFPAVYSLRCGWCVAQLSPAPFLATYSVLDSGTGVFQLPVLTNAGPPLPCRAMLWPTLLLHRCREFFYMRNSGSAADFGTGWRLRPRVLGQKACYALNATRPGEASPFPAVYSLRYGTCARPVGCGTVTATYSVIALVEPARSSFPGLTICGPSPSMQGNVLADDAASVLPRMVLHALRWFLRPGLVLGRCLRPTVLGQMACDAFFNFRLQVLALSGLCTGIPSTCCMLSHRGLVARSCFN